jgi:hypothetical protein
MTTNGVQVYKVSGWIDYPETGAHWIGLDSTSSSAGTRRKRHMYVLAFGDPFCFFCRLLYFLVPARWFL